MVTNKLQFPASKVSVTLSDNASPKEVDEAFERVCTSLVRHETSAGVLRFLLGKMLQHVQDKNLYKPTYPSFEKFTAAISEKYRLSRASLRDSMMVVAALPTLTSEQAAEIPGGNLTTIAKAVKNAPPEAIPELLTEASRKGLDEFRAAVTERGYLNPPATDGAKPPVVAIRITVPQELMVAWEKFLAGRDPKVVFEEILRHEGALPSATPGVVPARRAATRAH